MEDIKETRTETDRHIEMLKMLIDQKTHELNHFINELKNLLSSLESSKNGTS